jgi:hypothetical protein
MTLNVLKTGLALAICAAWLMSFRPAVAQGDGDGDGTCPGCAASATPASLHFPALPPATCGVLFNIYSIHGECRWKRYELDWECEEEYGCFFWYQVLCQGDCGNVVPALYSLGGTALPLYTPCGTNQNLGTLPCGYDINATFMVWDVSTGATAVKRTTLACSECEDDDG